jgi:hypothetical protein
MINRTKPNGRRRLAPKDGISLWSRCSTPDIVRQDRCALGRCHPRSVRRDVAITLIGEDCFARFVYGEKHASAQREGLATTCKATRGGSVTPTVSPCLRPPPASPRVGHFTVCSPALPGTMRLTLAPPVICHEMLRIAKQFDFKNHVHAQGENAF